MRYNLNINTNTYHIEGLCFNSTPRECRPFPTENEVLKYGGKMLGSARLVKNDLKKKTENDKGVLLRRTVLLKQISKANH